MSGIFWPSLLGKVIRTLITSDYQKSIETRFPRIENLRETCGHARPICSDFWKKKESICSLVCNELRLHMRQVNMAIYELSAADVTMGFEKDIHGYKNVN